MKSFKIKSLMALALAGMLVLSGCGGGQEAAAPEQATEKADLTTQTVDIHKAEDPSKNPQQALDRKDTIVVGMTEFSGKFMEQFRQSSYDMYVNQMIFEQLVEIDDEGKPVDEGIATWTVENDNKYIFKLKDGIKFSDGTDVKAEDVEFSFLLLADPNYDGDSDMSKYGFVGFDDYKNGSATSIEGIKVIDDKTIEFTLEEPNAEVIYFFTNGIVPKAYYGANYTKGDLSSVKALLTKPMGSGPYKMVEYKEGQSVTFTANEHYWKGQPAVKNVIFTVTAKSTAMQSFLGGQTDIEMMDVSIENVEQLKAAGFVDLHRFPTNGYGYLGMNNALPKFSDKRVRQALAYALNRKDVVEAIYGPFGNVLNVPQSRVAWSYSEEGINEYGYDMEKAAALLDEAGWTMGDDGFRYKDGEKFEIFFTGMADHPVLDIMLPVMIESYKQLGIDLKVEYVDFPTLTEKTNNFSAEMWFMAWGLTPDPGDSSNVYKTGGPQNKYNYANPKVDELFIQGSKETDFEKRKAIYAEIYKILNDELPCIIVYQRSDMWAANSRLEGFHVTPYKEFTKNLWKVTIKE